MKAVLGTGGLTFREKSIGVHGENATEGRRGTHIRQESKGGSPRK